MNDRAKQKLVQLLDEETLSVLDDPERMEGLLRDYCGDCRREISALIAALQEDVPTDLTRGSNEPYPILTARLAGKLHEERNIIPEAAQWAVETWAFALEVAPGSKRHVDAGARIAREQTPPPNPAGGGGIPAPGPGNAGGAWTMPPPVDVNVGKTPLPGPLQGIDGGWNQAPPGLAPKTPLNPPWQPEPWKTPPINPQPWVAPNAGAIPEHKSILVSVICFGVTMVMVVFVNQNLFGPLGGLPQAILVISAMLGGIELLLAAVRAMLKRQHPPAFVLSSMSFWMSLFSVEDLVLRVFSGKRKPQLLMAAPAAFPNPVPPAPQNFAQSPVSAVSPLQTPVGTQAAPDGVFCISCGKTNPKGSVMCGYCGEKLYYPEAQPGAAPN